MSDNGSLTGRFASFTAHVLATASTPILGPAALILANPIADLIKGLAGDHVPGISDNLIQRFKGLDASKLNHDIQKGLMHALANTGRSLKYVYEHPAGEGTRTLSKGETMFLDDLFLDLDRKIKDEAGTSSSLKVTETILGGNEGPSRSILLTHSVAALEALRRNAPAMADIVVQQFDRHFQLHFSEYLKDKRNSKALVAYEQLTARELLDEVRSLRSELTARPEPAPDAGTTRNPDPERERLRSNIDRWLQEFPDADVLGKALAPALEASMEVVSKRLAEIKSMLGTISDRTVVIERTVEASRSATGLNIKLTVLVLFAVMGVGLFFVLDPVGLRSFRVKVEINEVHDYGMNGRQVKRIAIEYADGSRDTAEVSEGLASFRVPDEFRNDDASLRLLCQGAGQSSRELAACDSQTIRLSDLDRILFPKARQAHGEPIDSVRVAEQGTRRTITPTEQGPSDHVPSAPRTAKAPCGLDGLEFHSDSSLEDKLTLSASGPGSVMISGEVNRKPVDGSLRINGATLTALPGEGSIRGGSLTLLNDCRQLKGRLTVTSPSGVRMTVAVNMLNSSR